MSIRVRIAFAVATAAVLATALPVAAQATTKAPAKKPAKDSATKGDMKGDMKGAMKGDMKGMSHDTGGMDHMQHMMPAKKETMPSSGWKELDAYHALMMATWHPASQDGDMAPIRARAADMAAAAKTLAASTPPRKCATPTLRDAAAKLAPQTQVIADMVTRNESNNVIKDSLTVLHDQFEKLEEGCSPMKGKMKGGMKGDGMMKGMMMRKDTIKK